MGVRCFHDSNGADVYAVMLDRLSRRELPDLGIYL